jgi:membrane protease YdiL (CAAX protease family)
MKPSLIVVLVGGLLLISPEPAQAYIGPGGGISALGALLALLAAVVLAVIGFLWYPIKRLLRRRRETAPGKPEPDSDER